MNADGSNVRRLTNNQADDVSSPWSQEGTLICFTSAINGDWEIYAMNADGKLVSPHRHGRASRENGERLASCKQARIKGSPSPPMVRGAG
jgi:Tol biopolymer transport system component